LASSTSPTVPTTRCWLKSAPHTRACMRSGAAGRSLPVDGRGKYAYHGVVEGGRND
jgi:hypothetical protein